MIRLMRPLVPVLALLPFILIPGCGDDDPAVPEPPPDLTLSITCNNGILDLKLRNDGSAMPAASLFEAVFEDGERDSLFLGVGEADSVICSLSNIHGPVTVTSEEWGLTATAGDCLLGTLESLLADFDINTIIPRPLHSQDVTICTYKIYLNNLTYDGPTFELVPNDRGFNLEYTFSNIHGDIDANGSNWACADLDGDLSIDSIVSETMILIDEGGDPEVTLGESKTTISGVEVDIDGILGFLAGWIINNLDDMLVDSFEAEIESRLNDLVGQDLGALIVVSSGCGE